MVKAGLVFFVLFLSIAVNLPHGMIARLGFDADYLMAVLVAVALTGLIMNRNLFLTILVLLCSIAANLPEEIIKGWGFDRDYFLAILIILVVLPIGARLSGRY